MFRGWGTMLFYLIFKLQKFKLQIYLLKKKYIVSTTLYTVPVLKIK